LDIGGGEKCIVASAEVMVDHINLTPIPTVKISALGALSRKQDFSSLLSSK
jgi:hypothetical protein